MLFEVVKNEEVLMCTTQPICVYDDAMLKRMQNAGYTFRLDGKRTALKDVKSFRDSGI